MTRANGRRWMVGMVVLAAAVSVSGQSAVPAAPQGRDDLLPALLVEIRGLRAAMEQMASAGPRVQLFASRLQLQEGRINALARRLDSVRDSLAGARREYEAAQAQVTELDDAIASNATPPQMPRAEAEQMLVQRKRALKAAKATVDGLAAEEAQLVQDVTTEQGRWQEINQRLDDLERALAKR